MTLRDLSAKDVIQLKTGENLGRIDDVVFDEHGGQLQSVILRGRAHCFGLLGCDDEDRKSTRLNSSHPLSSRMPSSA